MLSWALEQEPYSAKRFPLIRDVPDEFGSLPQEQRKMWGNHYIERANQMRVRLDAAVHFAPSYEVAGTFIRRRERSPHKMRAGAATKRETETSACHDIKDAQTCAQIAAVILTV